MTAEPMRPSTKWFTQAVKYNGDSNSDDDDEKIEFIDVDLPYNKLSVQLLANDSISCAKKRRRITDDKDDEPPRPKAN